MMFPGIKYQEITYNRSRVFLTNADVEKTGYDMNVKRANLTIDPLTY